MSDDMATGGRGIPRRRVSCDQVAWLMNALDELATIARWRQPVMDRDMVEAAKLGSLLRIMDIMYAEFEDECAAGNALTQLPAFDNFRETKRQIVLPQEIAQEAPGVRGLCQTCRFRTPQDSRIGSVMWCDNGPGLVNGVCEDWEVKR